MILILIIIIILILILVITHTINEEETETAPFRRWRWRWRPTSSQTTRWLIRTTRRCYSSSSSSSNNSSLMNIPFHSIPLQYSKFFFFFFHFCFFYLLDDDTNLIQIVIARTSAKLNVIVPIVGCSQSSSILFLGHVLWWGLLYTAVAGGCAVWCCCECRCVVGVASRQWQWQWRRWRWWGRDRTMIPTTVYFSMICHACRQKIMHVHLHVQLHLHVHHSQLLQYHD